LNLDSEIPGPDRDGKSDFPWYETSRFYRDDNSPKNLGFRYQVETSEEQENYITIWNGSIASSKSGLILPANSLGNPTMVRCNRKLKGPDFAYTPSTLYISSVMSPNTNAILYHQIEHDSEMSFHRKSDDCSLSDNCVNLSELAAPPPVENRKEGHLYRHRTLEESFQRNNRKRNHDKPHNPTTHNEQPSKAEGDGDDSSSDLDRVAGHSMITVEIKLNCNIGWRQHSASIT
jgi:hypothetical protein